MRVYNYITFVIFSLFLSGMPATDLSGVVDEGKVCPERGVDSGVPLLGRSEGSGLFDHLQQVSVLLAHGVVPHAVPAMKVSSGHFSSVHI